MAYSSVLIAIVLSLFVATPSWAQPNFSESELAQAQISLERGICYGSCPIYKIDIFADGRVVFTSDRRFPGVNVQELGRFAFEDGVLLPGVHEDRTSPEEVRKLLKQFIEARFFDLKDEYAAEITDSPTYTLTLKIGKHRKQVVDYVGSEVGMPAVVNQLEDAVDVAANTDRWVRGTRQLIDWLERAHFDFQSPEAGELAAAAAKGEGEDELILELMKRGAPTKSHYREPEEIFREGQPAHVDTTVEQAILEGAIKNAKIRLFEAITATYDVRGFDHQRANRIFAEHSAACSPEMVDAFAKAGFDIDARTPRDIDEGENVPYLKSALSNVMATYGNCKDDESSTRRETVKRLLAHGADVNQRDSNGKTPIFNAVDAGSLQALLDAGSDVSVTDKEGFGALFASYNDGVALLLLKNGASAAGKNKYCQTLLDLANERNMPKLERWLLANPDAWKNKPETSRPCTQTDVYGNEGAAE